MPFIPLRDINTLEHIPFQYVTVGLIAVSVAVFGYQEVFLTTPAEEGRFFVSFAMIPTALTGQGGLPPALLEEALGWSSLATYAFLHADWLHLLGNMLFLWVFGDNVEDELGHLPFLAFYLAAAVLAGLAHLALDPASPIPLVGASGAVAGVLGAYLVLHPKAPVWILVLWRIPLRVPAWLALGGWIGFQLFMIVQQGDPALGESSVAWGAHIGGFIAGVLMILPLRRRARRIAE